MITLKSFREPTIEVKAALERGPLPARKVQVGRGHLPLAWRVVDAYTGPHPEVSWLAIIAVAGKSIVFDWKVPDSNEIGLNLRDRGTIQIRNVVICEQCGNSPAQRVKLRNRRYVLCGYDEEVLRLQLHSSPLPKAK